MYVVRGWSSPVILPSCTLNIVPNTCAEFFNMIRHKDEIYDYRRKKSEHLIRILTTLMETFELSHNVRTVFCIGHAKPFRGSVKHLYGCFS